METLLPVKGTEIFSSPCSIPRAAGLLRRFLLNEAAAEAGIVKGYLETVAESLDNMLARREQKPGSGKKAFGSSRKGLASDYFGTEPGGFRTRKSRQLDSEKTEKKVQALSDFEALLGNEIDNITFIEYEEQRNGELGFEENPGVCDVLAGPAAVEDDERESEKVTRKKKKKKKKSHVNGASEDVLMGEVEVATDGATFTSQEPNTSADKTETKRSKKKIILEGGMDNGLLRLVASPAKLESDHVEPVELPRTNRKKHKSNLQDGNNVAKAGSGELIIETASNQVSGRKSVVNDSGVQESRYDQKSKKRLSDGSPGDLSDKHRKSKKLRL